jgi:hypothetical protein
MPNYLRRVSVSEEFYKHVPRGGAILIEECSFADQYGVTHVAAIVRWYDERQHETRTAAFDAKTGEYLGETF